MTEQNITYQPRPPQDTKLYRHKSEPYCPSDRDFQMYIENVYNEELFNGKTNILLLRILSKRLMRKDI